MCNFSFLSRQNHKIPLNGKIHWLQLATLCDRHSYWPHKQKCYIKEKSEKSKTEHHGMMVSTPALYSASPQFEPEETVYPDWDFLLFPSVFLAEAR
jgi:hypothetical protein